MDFDASDFGRGGDAGLGEPGVGKVNVGRKVGRITVGHEECCLAGGGVEGVVKLVELFGIGPEIGGGGVSHFKVPAKPDVAEKLRVAEAEDCGEHNAEADGAWRDEAG